MVVGASSTKYLHLEASFLVLCKVLKWEGIPCVYVSC